MKTNIEIIELISRLYNERNIEIIKPYVHGRLHMFVPETLTGIGKKRAFLSYFEEEFSKEESAKSLKEFIHLPCTLHELHFLIMKVKGDRSKTRLISIGFEKNKIKEFHIVTTHVHPMNWNGAILFRFKIAKEVYWTKQMFEHAHYLRIKQMMKCIKSGADINAVNSEGQTVLATIAAASKFDYIPQKLSCYLAKVKSKEKLEMIFAMKKQMELEGETFYKDAFTNTFLDVFIKWVGDISQEERIEVLNKLIDKGANINLFKKVGFICGTTPLFEAIAKAETKTVQFLLSRGASLIPRLQGETTLIENAKSMLRSQESYDEHFSKKNNFFLEKHKQKTEEFKKIIVLLENEKTSEKT